MLLTALAIAEFNTLTVKRADLLFILFKIFNASLTFLPRIKSTVKRTLIGDNIRVFETNESNSYLLIVGDNDKNQDVITIFDITNLKKICEYIKQVSPYKISKMKFNPSDTNNLISCGKSNLRVFNLKNHCLVGRNVNLFQNKDKLKNIKRNVDIIDFYYIKNFSDEIFAITKDELLFIDFQKKRNRKNFYYR